MVFVLYCPRRPPKLSFRWARCLSTGSDYLGFYCNNQLLLHFSYSARGITARLRARTRASWGPVLRSSKRVQDTVGKAVRYRESTARTKFDSEYRILPEKQCDTERVPPERLARSISQACTRIAGSLQSRCSRPHDPIPNRCSKISCKQDPCAPAREILARKKNKTNFTEPSGCCFFSINVWRWLAVLARVRSNLYD